MIADQPARDRIATDLATTLVVEAAAGTGKTTALVGRVVALIRTGTTRLSRIVAVTFTDKAAGEMKLKLRERIEEERQKGDPAGRFEGALAELEAARIGTIHSLCADLLRERPIEAGIDPMFDVAAEAEEAALFGQAFDTWFQAVLADPPEGVRRLLRRPPHWDGTGPRDTLRDAGRRLVGHRDFRGRFRRDPFDRDAAIDAFLDELAELADLSPSAFHPDDWLAKQVALVHGWLADLRHRERVQERDHDGIEAELRLLAGTRYKWDRWRGWASRTEFAPGVSRDQVLGLRERVKARLDDLVSRCDADLAACLQHALWPLVDSYEALKEKAGRLDFLDLLRRTRDLLVGSDTVRRELQARFSHLLVDEFQDNDPLQTEIVLLLAADDPTCRDAHAARVVPGKLFLVGDPKQSIYRFRRADVRVYQEVKRRLVAQGAEVLYLSTSFRSDPRIQAAVNATFAARMTGGTQAEYVPLGASRPEVPGRPAVVALSVPEPYSDYGRIVGYQVEKSVPEAVAAFVRWLVEDSGWEVSEGDGPPVPVEARHVCLLFRRMKSWGRSITQVYTKALEDRDVPHVLVGGRSFHDREEVLAVRNALAAIEWPDDELSVFATLRGPLFSVGDDALLAWRDRFGRLHPLAPVEEDLSDVLREVAEPLAILGRLYRGRNRRPIADTVAQLLDATRAHAGLALWSGGEQVLANVLRVAEQGRRFEASGATSFRAFVEHLAAEAERDEADEAPVIEEGTEGVRLMTVHKAKGLEFPVVILCEPTCNAVGKNPSRWIDGKNGLWAEAVAGCVPRELLDHADEVLAEDAEESDRLLYVAATRARDLLVLPAVGDEEVSGWLDPLHPVLYPPDDQRTQSQPAPGCPPFGHDSVLKRGVKAPRGAIPVRPGLHAPREGEHTVVWWDPAALDLSVKPTAGIRSLDLLVEDADGASTRAARAHDDWASRREARLARASAPTVEVRTPTELSEDGGGTIGIEATDAVREARPHGRRFGILVHAVLAEVPLDAAPDTIARSAALHARLVGATPEELSAARDAVHAALAHPLMALARASDDCRREVPVTLRTEEGVLVEGIADLAFRDGGRWLVVDFKTDLDVEGRQGHYAAQVGWYVRAIAEATGEPAEGILLRV